MEKLTINVPNKYEVFLANGIIGRSGILIKENLSDFSRAVIVTDSNVDRLCSSLTETSLNKAGIKTLKYVFEAGEQSKNETTLFGLLNFLAENNISRNDIIIALGGGVTGDLSGFAASIYKRGIRFVQIPTTLLAMVDSSIGGKTAIDIKAGKNLIGSFYQPSLVLIDPEVLKTLDEKIYSDGCAEIIKYGVLSDKALFKKIKENKISEFPSEIIRRSLEIKAGFVVKDEHDNGIRQALNYGHTVAHAIEKCSDYTISHGQAVAMGMMIEAGGAFRAGLTDNDISYEIASLCKKYGLETECGFDPDSLFSAAKNDKKASGDTISFIVCDTIGNFRITRITNEILHEVIRKGLEK